MKRYIYIIVCLIASAAISLNVAAAADHKDKSFCFVYVAKSDATSVSGLTEYLDSRYKRAIEDEDYVVVMYLADEKDPYIVEVNTPADNRDAYAGLIEEIKSNKVHRIDTKYDLSCLTALFERLDVVSVSDDRILYGSVDWHFHVTSDFWKLGYNESLISSLCFVMGVDHLENANFRLRCYFNRNDEFEFDETFPFGKKNYCNLEFRPYYY